MHNGHKDNPASDKHAGQPAKSDDAINTMSGALMLVATRWSHHAGKWQNPAMKWPRRPDSHQRIRWKAWTERIVPNDSGAPTLHQSLTHLPANITLWIEALVHRGLDGHDAHLW